MKNILKSVLAKIKPTPEEEREISSKIDRVLAKVRKALPEANVILGGSGEKGTWLKEVHDADIFVKFPFAKYKDKSDKISDITQKKLSKVFELNRLHGSRDYFQTIVENFTFEIVPIIDIKDADKALNITDVSPLHATWVKKHSKYVDEIRLTKQFFKAAKVYGAESYINGFSGYICEILTVYYKGFEKLVKAVAKWKGKIVVDVEKYHKDKSAALFNIDKAKTHGPLVVIDPVQASRNAAAAVSRQKFDRLIEHCKRFVGKPSKELFTIKKIDVSELKKKKGRLFMFEAAALGGKDDVVGCKLLKAFEYIKKELEKNEFTLIYSDWEWEEKARFYLVVKEETLDKEILVGGPPAKFRKAVTEFKKVHKDTFEKDNMIFAKEKRQYRKAGELMKDLLRDEYILERVKSIKEV